jgi:hypothetical protein
MTWQPCYVLALGAGGGWWQHDILQLRSAVWAARAAGPRCRDVDTHVKWVLLQPVVVRRAVYAASTMSYFSVESTN